MTRISARRFALPPAMLLGTILCFAVQAGAWAGEDEEAIRHARGLSRAFRAAAKAVIPTVVEVRTTEAPLRPAIEGRSLPDLFGEQSPGSAPRGTTGVGSGVIIDPSGIVLTNNHVIDGAQEVSVVLPDGRQFRASGIKSDAKSDLAVMRVKADSPLPAARLGDSDKLEIGDWVLAVGNPFELESTVSAGIISAKSRSLAHVGRTSFLQTDAAINPGNSGGPLVNLEGEVVGINTAIASRSGGYQGIGFAIPIDVARWVVPQLLERGVVERSYLGVAIDRIDAVKAAQLGVRPHEGVVVAQVFANSPAAQAGLKENDIILTLDGRPVNSAAGLQEIVERLPPGSKHELRVVRSGQPTAVPIIAQAMPERFGTTASGQDKGVLAYQDGRLGLTATDLTPGMAEQLGFRPGTGAIVLRVDPQGIAGRAGLREGMLIVSVGNQAIRGVTDLEQALQSAPLATGVTMQVQTAQGTLAITLKTP